MTLAIQALIYASHIEIARDAISTCLEKNSMNGLWLEDSQKEDLERAAKRFNELLPDDIQRDL